MPQPEEKDIYRVVRSLRDNYEGRSNAVGECTLLTSTTTTIVSHVTVGMGSCITFAPLTANAGAIQRPYVLEANHERGFFTVTHTSLTMTDLKYRFAFIG